MNRRSWIVSALVVICAVFAALSWLVVTAILADGRPPLLWQVVFVIASSVLVVFVSWPLLQDAADAIERAWFDPDEPEGYDRDDLV